MTDTPSNGLPNPNAQEMVEHIRPQAASAVWETSSSSDGSEASLQLARFKIVRGVEARSGRGLKGYF